MTPTDLTSLLDRLTADWESEVVEFKEAANDFSTDRIGRYFSALSNEANLRGARAAWLVFGVSDKTHDVVGSSYRLDRERLHSLKNQVAQDTEPRTTFRDVHVLDHPDGRVVLMEVPAAPRGLPISWKGFYYGRDGESLGALNLTEVDRIRAETYQIDWTGEVVPDATMADIDPAAIARARAGFAERHSPRITPDEVESWDDQTFLATAGLTVRGGITRAALLLLGKGSSWHLLLPHMAEITWQLEGAEQAYEHFKTPFILTATDVYRRIRNVQVRLMPPNELLYREISKYDERSVLEAMYNAIAHQDYRRNSRVIVTEHPDRLVFTSVGEFFDGRPVDYVIAGHTPREYRNPFLVNAMTKLNLVDRLGYGIHRMSRNQIRRFLPLPEYADDRPREVRLTIYGAAIDEAFSQLLMVRTDLPIEDILALDRVQKRLPIPTATIRHLRRAGLVEGRQPHIRVSPVVAAFTGHKVHYIQARAQDDAQLSRLILDYLGEFGHASRRDIDELLRRYLDTDLTDKQRQDRVSNVLRKLRKTEQIHNAGSRRVPRWQIT